MNILELSSEEIIYIASLCDANVFYGISDGFYGMENSEIAVEINKIKVNLTNKGYAEMDFDGDFVVSAEVMNVISDCALCDRYISFDKIHMQKKEFVRCYLKDDQAYLMTENDGRYVIEKVAVFDIKEKLLAFVNWAESTNKVNEESVIKNELLYELKSMSEFDNPKNRLKESGCNADNAEIICDGLFGNAANYSLSVIDSPEHIENVDNLSFIIDKFGSLQISPFSDDENEFVKFKPVSYEKIAEEISAMLRKTDCDSEATFI